MRLCSGKGPAVKPAIYLCLFAGSHFTIAPPDQRLRDETFYSQPWWHGMNTGLALSPAVGAGIIERGRLLKSKSTLNCIRQKTAAALFSLCLYVTPLATPDQLPTKEGRHHVVLQV